MVRSVRCLVARARWPCVLTQARVRRLPRRSLAADYREVRKILLVNRSLVNTPSLNPKHNGARPLHFAAACNALSVVDVLVEHGADVALTNNYGENALHYAAREYGTYDTADALIHYGTPVNCASPDARLDTPAHLAARTGNARVLQLLKIHGANVHLPNAEGQTVCDIERSARLELSYLTPNGLFFAALQRGDVLAARGMVHAGEVAVDDRHANFRRSVTGLLFCCMLGRDAAAEVAALIQLGAHVDSVDDHGRTALMHATHRGHWQAVALLLRAGADATLADRSGHTALHLGFTLCFRAEIAAALLAAGAAPMQANKAGTTPLDLLEETALVPRRDGGPGMEEACVQSVELRAAFAPYQAESSILVRHLGRVKPLGDAGGEAASGRRGVAVQRALLFTLSLLGMVFAQPVLAFGALFSQAGYESAVRYSLGELALSRAVQVSGPVFGLALCASLLFVSGLMPYAVRRRAAESYFVSCIVLYLLFLAGQNLAAVLQASRVRIYRIVSHPSRRMLWTARNVNAMLMLALAWVQLLALMFGSSSLYPARSGERDVRNVLQIAVLGPPFDFPPIFLSGFALLCLWALLAANMGLSLSAALSPSLRALFPFLGRSAFDFYVGEIAAPLLTDALFVPIVVQCLRALACSPASGTPAGKLVLDADRSIVCWAGAHLFYSGAAMVGLLLYFPTTLLLGTLYLNTTGADNPRLARLPRFLLGPLDARTVPMFTLLERPLRALLAVLRVLFARRTRWTVLLGELAVHVVLLCACLRIRPYRDARLGPTRGALWHAGFAARLNRVRCYLYAVLVLKAVANVIALVQYRSQSGGTYVPVIVFYTGLVLTLCLGLAVEGYWLRTERAEGDPFARRSAQPYLDIRARKPLAPDAALGPMGRRARRRDASDAAAGVRGGSADGDGDGDDAAGVRGESVIVLDDAEAQADADARAEVESNEDGTPSPARPAGVASASSAAGAASADHAAASGTGAARSGLDDDAVRRITSNLGGAHVTDHEFLTMQASLTEQLAVADRERHAMFDELQASRAKNKKLKARLADTSRMLEMRNEEKAILTERLEVYVASDAAVEIDRLNNAIASLERDLAEAQADLELEQETSAGLRRQLASMDALALINSQNATVESAMSSDAAAAGAAAAIAVAGGDEALLRDAEQLRMRIAALEALVSQCTVQLNQAQEAARVSHADLVDVKLLLANNEFEKQKLLQEIRVLKAANRKAEADVAALRSVVSDGLVVIE